ncbi:uncharacterized protein RCO7_14382 [Rhynchosporium graminicola]|uniref:Uncharacterized protein n=2 Tax=Rhynchosporium TaxID=38037 RepID=A0A1E1MMY9_RHYSE|nr:uncharacterized protein RCO7_14382 [Rhynchosporium commune]CZT50446.1 uncharacterized protein RSE6_11429 [Rhynchosporium secalis]
MLPSGTSLVQWTDNWLRSSLRVLEIWDELGPIFGVWIFRSQKRAAPQVADPFKPTGA